MLSEGVFVTKKSEPAGIRTQDTRIKSLGERVHSCPSTSNLYLKLQSPVHQSPSTSINGYRRGCQRGCQLVFMLHPPLRMRLRLEEV